MTYNGSPVNGFPIQNTAHSMIFPYFRFLDGKIIILETQTRIYLVTKRAHEVNTGSFLKLQEFQYNWIWAHDFEGEQNQEGWLGLNLKFTTPPAEQLCMVMWVVYETNLTVDKFNTVEKN